jgi:uncharacterized protein (DUF927 family)
VRGTLDSWKEQVAARLCGNPLLLFVVCVAFVGPLLRRLKLEGGLFHVFGATSTGNAGLRHVKHIAEQLPSPD